MRKFWLVLFLFVTVLLITRTTVAEETTKIDIAPTACRAGACPIDLLKAYQQRGETCVSSLTAFQANPAANHFWIEDPEITSQGKADERARQFIYWALNKNSIQNNIPQVLSTIWGTTRNISYIFVVLIAAILGIGIIVGQRANFDLKLKVGPSLLKVGGAILYITFSATIVFFLIQMSDIMMKFFVENLGGRDLFNIYFDSVSNVSNYKNFVGCRDINIRVQESVQAQLMLLKITNVTYYAIGTLILLRTVILWFLLIVSPFLAILFPFKFIRNIGWVWIGEFFRWLFFGPLFALFLGALVIIWKSGIPFVFNFQPTLQGYVYPTATNILYGGPAQQLSAINSVNNVESFAEYVITLIMLWAVVILPWWLMKIFRDYCCQDVNAMKNILLSMYDQMRMGPDSQQPSSPSPSLHTSTSMKIPVEATARVDMGLGNIEQIHRAQTDQILRSLNLQASSLKDIAHLDTNKSVRQEAVKNIEYLKDPLKAEGSGDRQKFMGVRSELSQRALKEDRVAKQVLTTISGSQADTVKRQGILSSMPQRVSADQALRDKGLAQGKIPAVHAVFLDLLAKNTALMTELSKESGVSAENVQKTVQAVYQKENLSKTSTEVVTSAEQATGIDTMSVRKVLRLLLSRLKKDPALSAKVAEKETLPSDVIQTVLETPLLLAVEPEKNVEAAIALPSTVSLEEYEEVKKMWERQYEKGEVPLSSEITSRHGWIDQDIVFITNVLNKLLSEDTTLKEQGLDDLGYILPVFMINNFKADQILVYLKAKLEAAKQAQEYEQMKAGLGAQKEDAFVDAHKATKLEEKTLKMGNELKEES